MVPVGLCFSLSLTWDSCHKKGLCRTITMVTGYGRNNSWVPLSRLVSCSQLINTPDSLRALMYSVNSSVSEAFLLYECCLEGRKRCMENNPDHTRYTGIPCALCPVARCSSRGSPEEVGETTKAQLQEVRAGRDGHPGHHTVTQGACHPL